MSEHIIAVQTGAVVTLTIDRPDKKNALTNGMYGALCDAVEAAEADAAVRVITLRAAGDMFCAGNDIGDFVAFGSNMAEHNVFRFLHLLAAVRKPLLAAVQGRAVGIGTTMLLHCDYVVLADGAQLSTPFVNLGLVPEAASSLLLPGAIGHQRAFAVLAMGEALSADEAVVLGLANAVVAVDELDATLEKTALRIAKLPPGAVLATKALMRDSGSVSAKMDAENTVFAKQLQSREAREAFAAFMEKRPADFSRF